MKLRINGNSLRLRLGPSEVRRLLRDARVQETIRFAPESDATLTYALELGSSDLPVTLRYDPGEVTVLLSHAQAQSWADSDRIAIAADIDVGSGFLGILIEKDFACLDRSEEENEDTFPHPKAGAVC